MQAVNGPGKPTAAGKDIMAGVPGGRGPNLGLVAAHSLTDLPVSYAAVLVRVP
jgi:hypothetical protein